MNIVTVLITVGKVFAILVACLCVLSLVNYLLDFLKSVATHFDKKALLTQSEYLGKTMLDTADVLVIIDKIIDMYLNDMANLQLALNVEFNYLKLDDAIAELANKVHNALPEYIFSGKNELFVNGAYLEDYIVSSSTAKLINMYKATNTEINMRKAGEQE